MGSKNRLLAAGVSAVAVIAFWFGTGLQPYWGVTWLGPFFAFFAVAHLRLRSAGALGFLIFLAGELNLWAYLSFVPPVARLALLVIPACAFAGTTAMFSACYRAGRSVSGLIGPAALWTSFEFGYSALSPHSTFGAIAYSQSNFLPAIQLAALGGIWPIGFLLFFVGAGAALVLLPSPAAHRRRNLTLAIGIPLVAVITYGFFHLRSTGDGPNLKIALLASDLPENANFEAPDASVAILKRYLEQIPSAAQRGVQLVVLPEHLFALREGDTNPNATEVNSLLQTCAAKNRTAIVVGVDRVAADQTQVNEARLYSPSGDVVTYTKQHLLPGYESRFRPGTTFSQTSVGGVSVGLAVCKDLDFPELGRAYGTRGAAVLAVPAYDFHLDGWLHARMAVVRGVESGFAIARSARNGRLTVSDNRGRVRADLASQASPYVTVLAECPAKPEPTLYSHLGDWFGWLAVATFVLVILGSLRRTSPEHLEKP